MKILVTGITGFIGRNFARTINDENEYIFLVRNNSKVEFLKDYSNVNVVKTDFSKKELSESLKDVEIVVHMIGQMGGYGVSREQFEKINCDLTRNILKVCVETKIKQFIYLSTPGVQGF